MGLPLPFADVPAVHFTRFFCSRYACEHGPGVSKSTLSICTTFSILGSTCVFFDSFSGLYVSSGSNKWIMWLDQGPRDMEEKVGGLGWGPKWGCLVHDRHQSLRVLMSALGLLVMIRQRRLNLGKQQLLYNSINCALIYRIICRIIPWSYNPFMHTIIL